MRAIIWGINYAPEPTGTSVYSTDLAEYLHRKGAMVEVVAGFPHYPSWTKRSLDRWRFFRDDQEGTIRVHRCWQYVPRRLTALRRMLHEMSFAATSAWRVLWLNRADVYVVVSPPPGLGWVAWLVTRLKNSIYLLHVHDLAQNAAGGLGMVRSGFLLHLRYAFERFVYRHATGVSGVSLRLTQAFAAMGVHASRIFLLPNWTRTAHAPEAERDRRGRFRWENGIPSETFLAVYSGNLGCKQELEVLVSVAEYLAGAKAGDRSIRIVIAGEGAAREALEESLRRRPLSNLTLLPLQSNEAYQGLLRDADVALISQLPGTGRKCFPRKLLSVLGAGLPVLSAADETSELAEAVRQGGFGWNVPAGDPMALAEVIQKAALQPELLRQWRERTRWVGRFAPELILAKFEQALRSLAAQGHWENRVLRQLPGPREYSEG